MQNVICTLNTGHMVLGVHIKRRATLKSFIKTRVITDYLKPTETADMSKLQEAHIRK